MLSQPVIPVRTSQVQSIDRVGDILRCFSLQEPVLSLTEISRKVNLAKSTTHRLIASLVQNGLLRTVDSAQYALGYQMLHWAAIAQQALDLRSLARPFLEELAHLTSETVVLMTRDGNYAVCIDKLDSPRPLRIAMTVGERIWLHAGSSAKVLMAYLPPQELLTVIQQGLPPLTENTIVDPQLLQAELEQIRKQGYAVSFAERDQGAAGVAAAIFDSQQAMVAGIGIVGPVARLSAAGHDDLIAANLIKTVVTIAAQISQQMGAIAIG